MALEAAEDILALADGLTDAARALHDRILAGIQAGTVDQAGAAALFEREAGLRAASDALCADAAARVVAGLALAQDDLIGVVRTASARMLAIQKVGRILDLAGSLVALGTAVLGGEPEPILAAVGNLRDGFQNAK